MIRSSALWDIGDTPPGFFVFAGDNLGVAYE